VYADDAGSHDNGPTTAPGILLLNTATGVTDVVATRSYSEPYSDCGADCGNSEFVTEAQIVGDWLYWIELAADASPFDGTLHLRLLAGGETADLLTGQYQFDDASCVTTSGADVRVSGYAPGDVALDTPRLTWDTSGDHLTPVTRVTGPDAGSGAITAQTCAGVDVVVWITPLDESTPNESIATDVNGRPVLLNAIDFVRPEGRARVSNDDPLIGLSVESQIRGWAVVWPSSLSSEAQRFLLLDTDAWHLYEVTPPEGMVVTYARVSDGQLIAYLGVHATGEHLVMSAPLP
jgi:hypothetical protein